MLQKFIKKNYSTLLSIIFAAILFLQSQCVIRYMQEEQWFPGESGWRVMQTIQIMGVFLLCFFCGRIIDDQIEKRNKNDSVATMLMLFCIADVSIFNDIIYNYSVNLLYMWPIVIFAAVICLLTKVKRINSKYLSVLILLLFVGFNLVKGITVVPIKEWSRNLQLVIQDGLVTDNCIIAVLISMLIGGGTYLYLKKDIFLEISFLFSTFFIANQYFEFKILDEIQNAVRMICFFTYIALYSFYLFKKRRVVLLSIFVGAVFSQLLQISTEEVSAKNYLIIIVVFYMMIATYLADIWKYVRRYSKPKQRCWGFVGMAGFLIFVFCIGTMSLIKSANNMTIYMKNHAKIVEICNAVERNEDYTKLELYRMPEEEFLNSVICENNYINTENWIRKEFDIPGNIGFFWKDVLTGVDYEVTDGVLYHDRFMGEYVEIVFEARREKEIILQFYNARNLPGMDITCEFDGEKKVYSLPDTDKKYCSIMLPKGESKLKLTASEAPVGSDKDWRKLSIFLHLLDGDKEKREDG